MTASDVVNAVQEQNQAAVAGPARPAARRAPASEFQLPIDALGRLTKPEQFGDIIVKTGRRRPERRRAADRPAAATWPASNSARSNTTRSALLDGQPSVGLADLSTARHQRPGHGRPRAAEDGRAEDSAFPTGSTTDRLRHDAVHPRVDRRSRSRRCATP